MQDRSNGKKEVSKLPWSNLHNSWAMIGLGYVKQYTDTLLAEVTFAWKYGLQVLGIQKNFPEFLFLRLGKTKTHQGISFSSYLQTDREILEIYIKSTGKL